MDHPIRPPSTSDGLDDDQLLPSASRERQRRIKLSMLMQQLDFSFYALSVLAYVLDGKTLIFILRTVSEVQFSQPKQIQPDRPLRFFTLASLTISVCAALSHLSILSSPTNFASPRGIFVDFIGQAAVQHKLAKVAFLVGLDAVGCLAQLLLVLLSFTDAHAIPIRAPASERTLGPSPPGSPRAGCAEGEDGRECPGSPTSECGAQDTPLLSPNSAGDDGRESAGALFELRIPRAIALLLSPDPPVAEYPDSSPRSSIRPAEPQLPDSPTDTLSPPTAVPPLMPPRAVYIPIG